MRHTKRNPIIAVDNIIFEKQTENSELWSFELKVS